MAAAAVRPLPTLMRPLRALLVACAILGLAAAAAAQDAAPVSGRPLAPHEVRDWLMRIHDAASRRNFQGTFVVSAGASVSSARIAHFSDGLNQLVRIDSLDGQMRRVLRHNDMVYTLWPQSRTALIEQRELLSTFPALLQGGAERIVAFYELIPLGTERVAGHEAHVLLLHPKDDQRYAWRLWAERQTGLLLRAEMVNGRNEVLEASAFSEVAIGIKKPHADSMLQPVRHLDGWRVVRPTMVPTQLAAEGWTLKQPVAGFEPVSCVRRPLGSAAGARADGAEQVLQAIWSDGLTYVSLFIEPYDAERHTRPMQTVIGATQTLMQRRGAWWITVVGDVPASTLAQFARALERKS